MEVLPTSPSLPSVWPARRAITSNRRPLQAQEQLIQSSDVVTRTEVPSRNNDVRQTTKLSIPSFNLPPHTTPSPVRTLVPGVSLNTSASTPCPDVVKYTTAIPISPDGLASQVLNQPPTWISTPPTPPPRTSRRTVTSAISQVTALIIPSTSFPACCTSRSVSKPLRRCASFPPLPPYPRAGRENVCLCHESLNSNMCMSGFATLDDGRPIAQSSSFLSVERQDALPFSIKRTKAVFHMSVDTTDIEDSANCSTESLKGSVDEDNGDRSHYRLQDERYKDNVRKYHALMELLVTELGYLKDLRILVTLYLRGLASIPCRAPSSSSITFGRAGSFNATSRHNYQMQLGGLMLSSSPSANEAANNEGSSSVKDQLKSQMRPVFTKEDIAILTRNAEEILELHEQFVKELRILIEPLGYSGEMWNGCNDISSLNPLQLEHLEDAIRTVATKFATEASRFDAYQTFCAGHPEALQLVKKISQHCSLEWETFEQRCSYAAQDLFQSSLSDSSTSQSPLQHSQSYEPRMLSTKDRIRTSSLTSLDGAVRSLRYHLAFHPESKKEKGRRLSFSDYMIKPIQRICRYPLLLDQLKPGKALQALSPTRSNLDVIVDSAAQAMKHVAASVDEARRLQDVAIQSSLIISRMSIHTSSVQSRDPIDILTPAFLTSLGNCVLAGSLEVMHHHTSATIGTTSIKAKYLGAFLYPGGYLILVKVAKGKAYEPRHWFPLRDFELIDVDEDEAWLPSSFRLSCKGHIFELAVSCPKEKAVWLNAITDALKDPPCWTKEPISSLLHDGKGELVLSPLDDEPFESLTALPTIQSIPELGSDSPQQDMTESLLLTFPSGQKRQRRASRNELFRQEPPSRRSSTASVKAMFAPMSTDTDTIIIRRCSVVMRSQVDQSLHDVVSQSCITARTQPNAYEDELLRTPKNTRSAFGRSTSAMSVAGIAKGRLSLHGSIRVSRRKSMIESPDCVSTRAEMIKHKRDAIRKQSDKLTLTINPYSEGGSSHIHNGDSTPFSRSSSATDSVMDFSGGTATTSPSLKTPPIDCLEEPKLTPSRRKSLVKGVRRLFSSSSPSDTSSSPQSSKPHSSHVEAKSRAKSNVTRKASTSVLRRAIGSLHRHSGSAPDVADMMFAPIALATPTSAPLPTALALPDTHMAAAPPSSPNPQHKRRSFLYPPIFSSAPSSQTRTFRENASFLQRIKP